MPRSVPPFPKALRAVALVATLGGQLACATSTPVVNRGAPLRPGAAQANLESGVPPVQFAASVATADPAASKVVIRDYWRAPRASVVAWGANENWQGLRSAVLTDGTIAYDHLIYLSAFSVPNPQAFASANWYAFSDANIAGTQLLFQGVRADQFNCQGPQGCSPYITYQARVPDALLRSSRDSLVVRVVSYSGHETHIAIKKELIASYLTTLDSLAASRKASRFAGNQ